MMIHLDEGVSKTVPITFYADPMERQPRNLLADGYGARAVLIDERGVVVPGSMVSTTHGGITLADGDDNLIILWGAGATAYWTFEQAECQVDLTLSDQPVQRIKFNVGFGEDGRT